MAAVAVVGLAHRLHPHRVVRPAAGRLASVLEPDRHRQLAAPLCRRARRPGLAANGWRIVRRGIHDGRLALAGTLGRRVSAAGRRPPVRQSLGQARHLPANDATTPARPPPPPRCCASTASQSTEQEMAELCLTRHGTSWQGLYRGLKLKTAGTGWDVASLPLLRRRIATSRRLR